MFLAGMTLAIVVLFVVGVAFIYRGYVSTPLPEEVVPSEDLDQARAQLGQAQEQEDQLKVQLDSLAVTLEETKGQLDTAQKSEQELEAIKVREQEGQAQLSKLEQDVGFVAAKADAQAQKAMEVINALMAKREELEGEVKSAENKIDPQDVAQLNTDNQQLKDRVDESLTKIRELESALTQTQEQAQDMAEKAKTCQGQTVEELEGENKSLKEGLININSRIEEVEAEFQKGQTGQDQAVADVSGYLEELTSTKEEIGKLRGEITALQGEKTGYEQKINDLESRPQGSPTADSGGASSLGTAEILREKEDLENGIRQLKEVNRHLMEKEKKLSFELGRSRAQALGLEKICQGLKNDLDQTQQ